MNGITAKYFSSKFVIENKLTLADVALLEYLYSWILSETPPDVKLYGIKKAFWISQSKIAQDFEGLMVQAVVSQRFRKFERIGLIEKKFIEDYYCFRVCFNWKKVLESLAPQEWLKELNMKFALNWFEKIFSYMQEEQSEEAKRREEWQKKPAHEIINGFIEEEREQKKKYIEKIGVEAFEEEERKFKAKRQKALLLDIPVDRVLDDGEKLPYCKQSDAIAKKVLWKYGLYFQNRVPKEGEKPTKTYIKLCHKIEDIYNGRFTSSRYYNFNEKVFSNKQFETDGWREKINAVKGNWKEVKRLIFNACENFALMYDENRMPFNKNFLTTSLNDWFFSDNPTSKGQSQFIQSLNEPMVQGQKLDREGGQRIANKIKQKSPVAYESGHELNELLPVNASESVAWRYIKNIINWGKLLYEFEPNAKYFLECEINGQLESGAKVLPALFARYLKENKISVSLGTLDIEKSVDNNAPWRWFIEDACRKHEMNMDFVQCFNASDFYDAGRSSNIENDDYEIPVF